MSHCCFWCKFFRNPPPRRKRYPFWSGFSQRFLLQSEKLFLRSRSWRVFLLRRRQQSLQSRFWRRFLLQAVKFLLWSRFWRGFLPRRGNLLLWRRVPGEFLLWVTEHGIAGGLVPWVCWAAGEPGPRGRGITFQPPSLYTSLASICR